MTIGSTSVLAYFSIVNFYNKGKLWKDDEMTNGEEMNLLKEFRYLFSIAIFWYVLEQFFNSEQFHITTHVLIPHFHFVIHNLNSFSFVLFSSSVLFVQLDFPFLDHPTELSPAASHPNMEMMRHKKIMGPLLVPYGWGSSRPEMTSVNPNFGEYKSCWLILT